MNEKYKKLVELVGRMRYWQSKYFATKSVAALIEARKLEMEVDELLRDIQAAQAAQAPAKQQTIHF
jgi:hypothetical protein